MKQALFYMPKDRSASIIKNHTFYVEQATKRLLLQFNDIEAEADKYGETKLEAYAAYYNPEIDNGYELQEAAYEEMCAHYNLLGEMRERTRLSVVAGIFHEWEKQLRDWMAKELNHWPYYIGENTKRCVWNASFSKIIDFLEILGWPIKSNDYYNSLNKCRLLVNAYKHGNGDSFLKLKKEYPEFLDCLNFSYIEYTDYTNLRVSDSHIVEFSNAIIAFWKDAPEYIWDKEELEVPDWFAKTFEKKESLA